MGEGTEVRKHERYQVAEYAISVATRIISDGSDGSEEEINDITAMVAKKLVEMALAPLHNEMLKKDLPGKMSSPGPCD